MREIRKTAPRRTVSIYLLAVLSLLFIVIVCLLTLRLRMTELNTASLATVIVQVLTVVTAGLTAILIN